MTKGRKFQQKCLLKSTVFSLPSSQDEAPPSSLARLSIALLLEDLGEALDGNATSITSLSLDPSSCPAFRKPTPQTSGVIQKESAQRGSDPKTNLMTETLSSGRVLTRQTSIVGRVRKASRALRDKVASELESWKIREKETFMVCVRFVNEL